LVVVLPSKVGIVLPSILFKPSNSSEYDPWDQGKVHRDQAQLQSEPHTLFWR
jgi:hypothetical protein